MNAIATLVPVMLIIASGWLAARLRWIRAEHLPSLLNVVFMLLTPALLFRTMSQTSFAELDYTPAFIYLSVAVTIILLVALYLKTTQRSFIIGLACVFSNLVMVGIPMISMLYGPEGLIPVITLVSVHPLVLLSVVTLFIEWRKAEEEALDHVVENGGNARLPYRQLLRIVGKTAYRAVVHPVILPIVAGIIWGITIGGLPSIIDKALQTLGQANGPMSLVAVGATLAHTRILGQLKKALAIGIMKSVVMPACVFAALWFFGVRGLTLAVLTIVAALPVGNNVYFVSHRYKQAHQTLVPASMALSTLLSMFTVAALTAAFA